MFKRIPILEDGIVSLPKTGRSKDKRGELPGRNVEDCQMSLRWEVHGTENVYGISPETKMLQDRGALPKEEGDVVRAHKAMHEENFLSSWLWDDVEGKEERTEEGGQGDQRRGEQKEEKRRWLLKEGVSTLSPLRLLIFSARGGFGELWELWGDLWGDSCGLSDCGSVALSGALVVTDPLPRWLS